MVLIRLSLDASTPRQPKRFCRKLRPKSVMQRRNLLLAAAGLIAGAISILGTLPARAQKPDKPTPPQQGPRATAVHDSTLYVAPDEHSEKLAKVYSGREMVIAERSGEWIRVFANTDVEAESQQDAPIFGEEAVATPISGWLRQNGVVTPETQQGDAILFGVAANFEEQASEANPPHGAAQSARLLYRRMAEIFPDSPRAAEAAWRAADIR